MQPLNMRPDLLVVTPRYPYPVVGGDRVRIFQLCKALSANYRLTLLSLCETKAELNAPLPDDGVFANVERLYWPRWRSWINCVLALPTRLPLQVAYYNSPEMTRRIQQLAPLHHGVLAHLIRAGHAARNLSQPHFLEMTDAISLNYQRVRNNNTAPLSWLKWVYRLESTRLQAFEKAIAADFDHTFLVSEIDRQFLFWGTPELAQKVSVVTNGVSLHTLPFRRRAEGQEIIFIGNMLSLPNQDAVHYLATQILPLVRAQHPLAKLRVIGRIGLKQRASLERLSHVLISGEVEDVAVAAQGGTVGVCPMRLGAGVQNKLLEYMALGLPAVSSTIGLQGLAARPGIELLVADDPQNFAKHINTLFSNQQLSAQIACAAREYVENHHEWQSVAAPLLNIFNEKMIS
jgi:glycosyltransferase involved in cell wall biosynthesis